MAPAFNCTKGLRGLGMTPSAGLPHNGVCWTISTMMFFYMVYPWLAPRLQRVTNTRRLKNIMYALNWGLMQAGITAVFLLNLAGVGVSVDNGNWLARAFPPFRLPVFVMGCLAAKERVERHEEPPRAGCLNFGGACTMPTGIGVWYLVMMCAFQIMQRFGVMGGGERLYQPPQPTAEKRD